MNDPDVPYVPFHPEVREYTVAEVRAPETMADLLEKVRSGAVHDLASVIRGKPGTPVHFFANETVVMTRTKWREFNAALEAALALIVEQRKWLDLHLRFDETSSPADFRDLEIAKERAGDANRTLLALVGELLNGGE